MHIKRATFLLTQLLYALQTRIPNLPSQPHICCTHLHIYAPKITPKMEHVVRRSVSSLSLCSPHSSISSFLLPRSSLRPWQRWILVWLSFAQRLQIIPLSVFPLVPPLFHPSRCFSRLETVRSAAVTSTLVGFIFSPLMYIKINVPSHFPFVFYNWLLSSALSYSYIFFASMFYMTWFKHVDFRDFQAIYAVYDISIN